MKTISHWIYVVFALSCWLLIGCKTPDHFVEIGKLSDFPIGNSPYLITSPQGYLVRSRDDEIHLVIPHPTDGIKREYECLIIWAGVHNRFEDPCGYSMFNLEGTILFGISKRDLDEYPVKVVDGAVMVDPTTIIKGECRIVPQDPDPNNLEATPPPCDP